MSHTSFVNAIRGPLGSELWLSVEAGTEGPVFDAKSYQIS